MCNGAAGKRSRSLNYLGVGGWGGGGRVNQPCFHCNFTMLIFAATKEAEATDVPKMTYFLGYFPHKETVFFRVFFVILMLFDSKGELTWVLQLM